MIIYRKISKFLYVKQKKGEIRIIDIFIMRQNKMKEKLKQYKYFITIFLVALILSIPLFWEDLNVYYDDGIQHIARAYATYLSIINGEHTEVLLSLANGFGYSWDLFYGNLSIIMILIGKCIITTFIGGYRFTLFLGLLLSRNNNV